MFILKVLIICRFSKSKGYPHIIQSLEHFSIHWNQWWLGDPQLKKPSYINIQRYTAHTSAHSKELMGLPIFEEILFDSGACRWDSNQWAGLGKIYRKPKFLPRNIPVSGRFCLQTILGEKRQQELCRCHLTPRSLDAVSICVRKSSSPPKTEHRQTNFVV